MQTDATVLAINDATEGAWLIRKDAEGVQKVKYSTAKALRERKMVVPKPGRVQNMMGMNYYVLKGV